MIHETGKVAVVTGAASGIGAATVRALVANGVIVVGVDVDDAKGVPLFADLGEPHLYRTLDVGDPDGWKSLLDEVVSRFGKVDYLHLNAGALCRPRGVAASDNPLPWMTVDTYHKVVGVNLSGVVFGVLAAIDVPGLSRIIATSSGSAIQPVPLDPIYSAAKAGVLAFGVAMQPWLEARGIRLDVICFGPFDTAITPPDIREKVPHEPASAAGEAVAELFAKEEKGPVWLFFSKAQGLTQYELPSLP